MKIILENELEKYVWEMMMAAHCKWEKNHGNSLREQMDWYFDDLYRKETDKIVKEEVERLLRDEFGEEFFVSEDEYVESGLENDEANHEDDLREEYRQVQADIADTREYMSKDVRSDLRVFYYTFFNAPEKLTVIYNGEVIQGEGAE